MKREKYVLFRAIPPASHQPPKDWGNFLREASFLQLPERAERLAESVWLFPDDGKTYLALAAVAQKNATETQMLVFVRGSEWQPLSRRP